MSTVVRGTKRKLEDTSEPPVRHIQSSPRDTPGGYAISHDVRSNGTRPKTACADIVAVSDEPQPNTAHVPDRLNSKSSSPASVKAPIQTSRVFGKDASIVLIGIRGTGKSSLAVILSTATGRRLVDADRYFQQVTGLSRAAFKKERDVADYRQQESKVMAQMLAEHREGCVIVCGAASVERGGQKLLEEYAKTNPVIHVLRDAVSIQKCLKAWDTDKVNRFLEISGPLYRACSNLEFFNVSETGAEPQDVRTATDEASDSESNQPRPPPFLTLKKLEQDFLRFVAFTTGNTVDLRKLQAGFPLSLLPVESRSYTYAVSVPLSGLLSRNMDIEELEATTDAFEIVIDISEGAFDDHGLSSMFAHKISHTMATVRRNIIVPIIYHVQSIQSATITPVTSGNTVKSKLPDQDYLKMVEHGLRLAPEFLTVDLSYDDSILTRVISAKGFTKIIGHFSSDGSTVRDWDGDEYMKIYERAASIGCDLVRISQPALKMDDNFAVQRFRHRISSLPEPHPPIIAYNTGALGRLSCCFNPTLTPVIHASLISPDSIRSSPSIMARDAQQALFTSFVLDPMRFYVFGANVEYSLSPIMHNAAHKECGMPHHCKVHQANSLRDLNELVEDHNFGGASISLPYKTEAIPLLHSMSPHARAIGAINTILPIRTIREDGSVAQESDLYMEKNRAGPIRALHGDNTDWIGIRNCIRRGLSPANAVRPTTTGLVIGAGGMARAAIYSLIHLGVENIFLYNRTIANAQKLAHHYNKQDIKRTGTVMQNVKVTVHIIESLNDPWPANYKQPTIVVCTIPAHSMGDQPAPNFTVPEHWLESPTGGVLVEKQMRALSHRGWVALDGLDVLPEHGFAQFELFTGRRAPRRLMRTIVLKEYRGDEAQHGPRSIRWRLEEITGQST
ncbi:quinate pathway repressor protein QutR [Paecilomyces variotii No. 5]|uniref:Quinate pathway repressor protein QutR n=1 Tax=Byssochlamys spectabilis (strain No. 5 / NBRC 109023) TaxID=1356009 RepID=V5FZE7_BYSSN|nr:quinate pathway repressor protein QutR [Paecilomyces variotii No. 5]